ncbi:MAG: hypothetical protein ACK4PN_15205, partial [Allorhizobium sp.]
SPSATFHQPKLKSSITQCWTKQPWPHNLNEMASGKPGAVQCVPSLPPLVDRGSENTLFSGSAWWIRK